MPIEPSYAFNTFNTDGAPNGSGVEMTDSFEDFRKKTNGIINKIENRPSVPLVHGLLTWGNQSGSFQLVAKNTHNVGTVQITQDQGIQINFLSSLKNTNVIPYGNLGFTQSLPNGFETFTGYASGTLHNNRKHTDVGTVIFHSVTQNSINILPYRGRNDNNYDTHGAGQSPMSMEGLNFYSALSFVIFGEK